MPLSGNASGRISTLPEQAVRIRGPKMQSVSRFGSQRSQPFGHGPSGCLNLHLIPIKRALRPPRHLRHRVSAPKFAGCSPAAA
jgi:hypothetical protein